LTSKGDLIDEGIMVVHIKTGKWIIGHNTNDKGARNWRLFRRALVVEKDSLPLLTESYDSK